MDTVPFRDRVHSLLEADLPSGDSVIDEGRAIARDVKIGKSAFMEKMGVASEEEYKRQCMRDGTIMYHAHIGMSTWQDTEEALIHIYRSAEDAGFRIDRAGLCLDRRMGLPKDLRAEAPAETGPILESEEDWSRVGRVVPIQPHMGDFMIGFPASTKNTVYALRAGVTTIGNLSQFFAHEVPGWRDRTTTTVETVRAMAVMAALRKRGTLIHSYLEDGFGAHFHDCATIAAWAVLERYIVEDLLGGKLAHCIGGLTCDPVKRAGWVFALDAIHDHDCVGSMFYGDTLSFTQNPAINQSVVAEYLIWDVLAQLECPTGHALLPIPVTEAIRVPSDEEIAEIQHFGQRMERAARTLQPHVDLSASRRFADQAVSMGKTVAVRALDGLKEVGVDVKDPVQLLYVMKGLGPAVFELNFGAGEIDEAFSHGRKPVLPTVFS